MTQMEGPEGAPEGALDEIRARRVTLVDGDGRPRVAFATAADGSAGLILCDTDERRRAELVLDDRGGAHLKLHDRDGAVCAWLAVDGSGAPSLYLQGARPADAPAPARAALAVDERGCPLFSLHDGQGQPRFLLALEERSGMPRLGFFDAHGSSRLVLSEAHDGTPPQIPGPAAAPEPTALTQPTEDTDRTTQALAELGARIDRVERRRGERWTLGATLVLLVAMVGGALGWVLRPEAEPVSHEVERVAQAQETPVALRPESPSPDPPSRPPDPPPAEHPRVLEAEELVLKSPDGTTRARLGALPDGEPYLQLIGRDGQGLVELAVLPRTGASLSLRAGSRFVGLSAPLGGGPTLSLFDGERVIFQAPDGTPRVRGTVR